MHRRNSKGWMQQAPHQLEADLRSLVAPACATMPAARLQDQRCIAVRCEGTHFPASACCGWQGKVPARLGSTQTINTPNEPVLLRCMRALRACLQRCSTVLFGCHGCWTAGLQVKKGVQGCSRVVSPQLSTPTQTQSVQLSSLSLASSLLLHAHAQSWAMRMQQVGGHAKAVSAAEPGCNWRADRCAEPNDKPRCLTSLSPKRCMCVHNALCA